MGMFLLLNFCEIFFEAVKALIPEGAVVFDPTGGFFEWIGFEMTRARLGIASTCDEARSFQDFQMLGDGRHAHLERLGEIGHGSVTGCEARQDSSAGRIGEGGEGGSELV